MKKITVHRRKQCRCGLIPYWIITSIDKESFCSIYRLTGDKCGIRRFGQPVSRIDTKELDKTGTRIKNGQTIELSVPDDVTSLFVSTLHGTLSDEIVITGDAEIEIITDGGFTSVSYPVITSRF